MTRTATGCPFAVPDGAVRSYSAVDAQRASGPSGPGARCRASCERTQSVTMNSIVSELTRPVRSVLVTFAVALLTFVRFVRRTWLGPWLGVRR